MVHLVKARHSAGPHVNGFDGCHARAGNNGICPGVGTAEWLNSLGDDEEVYLRGNSIQGNVTNLQVRQNWVTQSNHIAWLTEPIYDSCPYCKGTGRVLRPSGD